MITTTQTDDANFTADFAFPAVSPACGAKGHLEGDFDTGTTVVGVEHPIRPTVADRGFELLGELESWRMSPRWEEDMAVTTCRTSRSQRQRLGGVTM